MLVLTLLVSGILPLAWLLSEAQHRRWVSVVLGVSAITVCSFVGYGVGTIPLVFQLNTEFTGASRELIDVIVDQLEAGNGEQVLSNLKSIQPAVYENYENYPRYTEVVDKFVEKLETPKSQKPNDQ